MGSPKFASWVSYQVEDGDAVPQQLEVELLDDGVRFTAGEDGFRLHRILDPDSTSADAFLDGLELLYSLLSSDRGD